MSVTPVCYAPEDERVVGALGRAPIDGRPWEVRAYAATCTGIAATVGEVLPGLRAAADLSADRRGEAVVALCERAEKVVGNLAKVRDRYGAMGSALDVYAGVFDGAQAQSWQAHTMAASALDLIETYAGQLRELARASTTRSVATSWRQAASADSVVVPVRDDPLRGWNEGSKIAYDTGDPVQVARSAALDEQWAVVTAAKSLMDGAWDTLETAAGILVTALKELHDDGLDDGLRENASGVGHNLHLDDIRTAVADAVRWVNDHLDDIATIVGFLSVALCWIPVVGQVLAVAAVVLSAAVLLREVVAVVKDGKDWTALIMPAVGVLTFGVGRATTAAVKFSSAAGKAGTVAKAGNSADDVARTAASAGGMPSKGPASAWQAARQSLRPSAVVDDIATEAAQMKADGLTKISTWVEPSNLVPDGFKVLSNHMVTPGAQLSNPEGLTAAWNITNFTVDAVTNTAGTYTLLHPGTGD